MAFETTGLSLEKRACCPGALGSDQGNYLIRKAKGLNYGAYSILRMIFSGIKKRV